MQMLGKMIWSLLLIAFPAFGAQAVVVDLSERDVEIRYSFEGADLILFGSVDLSELADPRQPYDVVIVVNGPERPAVVRQKEKVGGLIWVNQGSVTFPRAPGYYAVASSRALADITSPETFAAQTIGFEHLDLEVEGLGDTPAAAPTFREALFRIRSKNDLYRQEQDTVTIVGGGLFRTMIRLPANVPVGEFTVDAYVFAHGLFEARDTIKLSVGKAGLERAVYHFAQAYPFFYGITAVLIALAAGWLAGVLGKK